MSKQEVFDVLETDIQSRDWKNLDSFEDLWLINDIDFTKDWDYSLPTIHSTQTISLRNNLIRDLNQFQALFVKQYSTYFSGVNFDNILIAGGCVTGVLLQQQRVLNNDVDIFIYGLNEKQANLKIKQLIQQIYQSYKNNLLSKYLKKINTEGQNRQSLTNEEIATVLAENPDINNIRNRYCLSLEFDHGQKIQIIFRLYRSISEILHGFDLGSSAIGYDGKQVYFTSLSRFSYEYLANIVDTTRRSTTYEHRLEKYYSRGFQIILPYLDISKLPTKYLKYRLPEVCQLPYFVFSYNGLKGNKIYLQKLIEWGPNVSLKDEEKPDSDYQPSEIDEYKVFYLNLKNLVKKGYDFYYYSERMNLDILKDPPYITSSRVIDFYDSIGKRIFDKSNFNANIFSTYFSSELIPDIVNQLFVEKNYKYLNQMIQKQKQLILNRLQKVREMNHSQINWITKNPGTQLTSSFNPIIADPANWYGDYYQMDPFETNKSAVAVYKIDS